MQWSVEYLEDPLNISERGIHRTKIARASCPLVVWREPWSAISSVGRSVRVAFADFLARQLISARSSAPSSGGEPCWELLDETPANRVSPTQRSPRRAIAESNLTPFILERTDVVATLPDDKLHIYLRVYVNKDCAETTCTHADRVQSFVSDILTNHLSLSEEQKEACMAHLAIAVFQEKLRSQMCGKAVAFVADGSILPRKSGASTDPMPSPPAIRFSAPKNSPLGKTISVDMGELAVYLTDSRLPQSRDTQSSTTLSLSGLLVPLGVSLIVGGGYHGKSTLLRCIAAGVYNKIPGDGREFCVTVSEALTIRAEDGRYVSRCNVSAFLSNLPHTSATDDVATTQFSTLEASGSTSQAANVVDAIEMGAKVFLVDEDVSAANFMARDGRMRALVMDESITPLLYRVNGMVDGLGISTVVVVGGVGDWLDVPDAVVLMDKYICKDATAKARSISKQFSHGHVQYAGHGVVHRLQWDKKTSPAPRRPVADHDYDRSRTVVTLMNGSNAIALHYESNGELSEDSNAESFIDMSRVEQLLGKKSQLFGCGLCVVWVLESARKNPERSLQQMLEALDRKVDADGFLSLLQDESGRNVLLSAWTTLVESHGLAYRPRRFEVGQAVLRLRTVTMEELPIEDDGSEAAAQAEAERRKRELLDIWNNRRKKSSGAV